jgi:hypothetical protein
MPWDMIEDIYIESMSLDDGAPAISARIAFGANFIKENENLTDGRTVEYIAENPYAQYFLGLMVARKFGLPLAFAAVDSRFHVKQQTLHFSSPALPLLDERV